MLSVARNWNFFRELGKRTPTALPIAVDGRLVRRTPGL